MWRKCSEPWWLLNDGLMLMHECREDRMMSYGMGETHVYRRTFTDHGIEWHKRDYTEKEIQVGGIPIQSYA